MLAISRCQQGWTRTVCSGRSSTLVGFILAFLLSVPATAQVERIDETFAFDSERPAIGAWLGNVEIPEDGPAMCHVVIEAVGSALEARVTLVPAGSVGREAVEVAIDGRAVSFLLRAGYAEGRFEGEVSEDGQTLSGAIAINSQVESKEQTLPFELWRTPRPTDLPEPATFSGSIDLTGFILEMSLVVARTPGGAWVGHANAEKQNLHGFPLVNMDEVNGVITGTLPTPVPALIKVTIAPDGSRMTGSMIQGEFPFELDFERSETKLLARRQQPRPPFPYDAVELVADHPDGHSLGGTLTIPHEDDFGPGPYPAVILVSGSGQQDRDETIAGHKPFLVIADALSRAGIAVMRYDDRGVGASAVDDPDLVANATTEDFASDTAAVLAAVRGHARIDESRVGLIGHSEGGLIAGLVAADDPDIACVVLLASPGVKGEALMNRQMTLAHNAFELTIEQRQALAEATARLHAAVAGGATRAVIAERAGAVIDHEIEAGLKPEAARASAIEVAADFYDSAWMRYFLAHDPGPTLARSSCPLLAMNGSLDMQVWHQENLDGIAKAGGDRVTVRRYDGLNHLFQPASSGMPGEYAEINVTFDEKPLAEMTAWLVERLRSTP